MGDWTRGDANVETVTGCFKNKQVTGSGGNCQNLFTASSDLLLPVRTTRLGSWGAGATAKVGAAWPGPPSRAPRPGETRAGLGAERAPPSPPRGAHTSGSAWDPLIHLPPISLPLTPPGPLPRRQVPPGLFWGKLVHGGSLLTSTGVTVPPTERGSRVQGPRQGWPRGLGRSGGHTSPKALALPSTRALDRSESEQATGCPSSRLKLRNGNQAFLAEAKGRGRHTGRGKRGDGAGVRVTAGAEHE